MKTVLEYTLDRLPEIVQRYDFAASRSAGSDVTKRHENELRKAARFIAGEVLDGTPLSIARDTVNKFLAGPGAVLNGDGKHRTHADPYEIISKAFWSKLRKIGGL